MFDFGFSEVLLTSAIALVVLGPERLPKVARQVGNWMGRARHMARQLSEQLEREVSADELMRAQNPKAQNQRLIAPVTDRTAPPQPALPQLSEAPRPAEAPRLAETPALLEAQTAHPEYEPPAVLPEPHATTPANHLSHHIDSVKTPNE